MGTLVDGGRATVTLIVFSRFNQLTRAAVPVLAGMSPMRPTRFIVASTVGAVLWGFSFTAIGVFAAEWWERSSGPIQAIMMASLAALAGAWFALSRSSDESQH